MHIIFEWDEAKRRANLGKHGLDFAAMERFDWETSAASPDTRLAYGEPRLIVLGRIDGRLHVLIATLRGDRMRIISLRKANERERRKWDAR
jgi:uncharacterized protein